MQLRSLFRKRQRRIYLDYAAATPVKPEIMKLMMPYFSEISANPSAIHKEGTMAREAIENAREEIARTLGIRKAGIVFTGSGTEANNLAIYGTLRALRRKGRNPKKIEVITTAIEHPSLLEVARDLTEEGIEVRYCALKEDGRIDEKQFSTLLNERTVLCTFGYVNSEIGVVQEVKRITRIVRNFNTANKTNILTHLDAAQAPLWLPLEMDMLGADLMSLDAGKCYGPKGVGVLAFRHGAALEGIVLGGGQEQGLRAGTENTPLIVGCASAIVRAQKSWNERSQAVAALRDRMTEDLLREVDGAVLNGSSEHRVANNINISIPGIDSEFAVVTLDAHGIAASTKSACSGPGGGGSHVVRELTGDAARADSTIRFSLGEETTYPETSAAVAVLSEHVRKMRGLKIR